MVTTLNPYPAKTETDLTFATSIEPGQPAYLCSLTGLYTVDRPTPSIHLDFPKSDNGQCHKSKGLYLYTLIPFFALTPRNERWIILFKNKNLAW